ncbi:MAG: hypothetical protein AAGI90_01320 [Chlamydiota bacterium]
MRQTIMNICAASNLVLFCWFLTASFSQGSQDDVLHAKTLFLQNETGSCSIEISCENDQPSLTMRSESGATSVQILGGETPEITIQTEGDSVFQVVAKNDHAQLKLGDRTTADQLSLTGGPGAGMFIKNRQNKVIGTWTMLQGGGTGIGLATGEGFAASILRGGSNPSVSFFSPNNEPMAAMGMIQQVPHLLIAGGMGNEGILMHGKSPSSMLFVDEIGKVKILISKNGVFQGSGHPAQQEKSSASKNKVFSFEDHGLFPAAKEDVKRSL